MSRDRDCDNPSEGEYGPICCMGCPACQETAAYWKHSYETEGRAHYAARECLDLDPDATDAEVMEAARRLK